MPPESRTDDGCQRRWPDPDPAGDTESPTAEPAAAAAKRLQLGLFTYLHVQDRDTGVARLVIGPTEYTLSSNERRVQAAGCRVSGTDAGV